MSSSKARPGKKKSSNGPGPATTYQKVLTDVLQEASHGKLRNHVRIIDPHRVAFDLKSGGEGNDFLNTVWKKRYDALCHEQHSSAKKGGDASKRCNVKKDAWVRNMNNWNWKRSLDTKQILRDHNLTGGNWEVFENVKPWNDLERRPVLTKTYKPKPENDTPEERVKFGLAPNAYQPAGNGPKRTPPRRPDDIRNYFPATAFGPQRPPFKKPTSKPKAPSPSEQKLARDYIKAHPEEFSDLFPETKSTPTSTSPPGSRLPTFEFYTKSRLKNSNKVIRAYNKLKKSDDPDKDEKISKLAAEANTLLLLVVQHDATYRRELVLAGHLEDAQKLDKLTAKVMKKLKEREDIRNYKPPTTNKPPSKPKRQDLESERKKLGNKNPKAVAIDRLAAVYGELDHDSMLKDMEQSQNTTGPYDLDEDMDTTPDPEPAQEPNYFNLTGRPSSSLFGGRQGGYYPMNPTRQCGYYQTKRSHVPLPAYYPTSTRQRKPLFYY